MAFFAARQKDLPKTVLFRDQAGTIGAINVFPGGAFAEFTPPPQQRPSADIFSSRQEAYAALGLTPAIPILYGPTGTSASKSPDTDEAMEDFTTPVVIQNPGDRQPIVFNVAPGMQIQATADDVIRFPDLDASQVSTASAGGGEHLAIALPGGRGEIWLLDFQSLQATQHPARIDWDRQFTSPVSLTEANRQRAARLRQQRPAQDRQAGRYILNVEAKRAAAPPG